MTTHPITAGRDTERTSRTRRVMLCTLTALGGFVTRSSAQTPVPAALAVPAAVRVNDRVRLTTVDTSEPLAGRLLAVRGDSLVIWRDCWVCGPMTLPRQSIVVAERKMGRSHPVLGGLVGFLVGASAGGGALVLYARHDMRIHPCAGDGPCGIGYVYAGPLVALATGIVGSIFGVSLSGDIWRPAALPGE